MKTPSSRVTTQPVAACPFVGEEDWWRIRNLLIETHSITPTGFNWDIRHWDGQRFHRENLNSLFEHADEIHLWETEAGQLVGAVHSEQGGNAWIEIHPDFRQLEPEMLSWAEAHLTESVQGTTQRHLQVFAFDYDTPRRRLLQSRGYEITPWLGVTRRMRFGNRELPEPEIAPGYVMRDTAPGDDFQRVADILNAAFDRTFHNAVEVGNFMVHSPSFRHDLDLAAIAPDGSFAAYVGVTYDEVNQCGIFEPVCTHPEHRRRGLSRALMLEGMHRLKDLGVTDAYVETGDMMPANELYDALGFTEAYRGYIWRKVF